MSMVALLVAVRDTLRTNLTLDNQTCRVRGGPKPPASCGDRFISIFGTDWSPFDYDSNRALDESFSIACAVTYRSPFIPDDEQGEQLYIEAAESLETLCRSIIIAIDKDYANVLARANSRLVKAGTTYNFFEPLRFANADAQPTPVGPDWFLSGRGKSESGGDETAGLVMQVNFSGARRKQPTGSAK